MEKEKRAHKAHCLVLPYPAQGHINPMLQFSKRLEHRGIKVTLVTTRFRFKSMHKALSSSIMIETISDGNDEGVQKEESFEVFWARFRQIGSETLAELLEKIRLLGCPVDCIVYDSYLPWVLDVAKKFGLVGAVFLTQSCAVDNIYYHVHHGLWKLPLTGPKVLVPGLPPLQPLDMPSFIFNHESSPPGVFEMVVNRLSSVDKADWVLCNTFQDLEEEVVGWMANLWRLRTIGPTIPSWYLDRQLQDDKDYGLSLYKPNTSACMKWLNEQQNGSVVFVSFGSLTELGIEQMEEIAWGLRCSYNPFLWVVRTSEEDKLPKDFVEETSGKGLVVSWCPQLEVLAHNAIGCFVTHCGWNSSLESLCLGVPMVTMPQWADQTTNAKLVIDFWKVGLKAQPDEKGIVRREVLLYCITEIMEGEKGQEIRRNAIKWRELARKAVEEDGSSDRNIDEFAAALVHS